MKISFSHDEITQGFRQRRHGEKQKSKLREEIAKRIPLFLSKPQIVDGRRITAVFPKEFRDVENGETLLTFKPIWARVMVGCHIRSSNIRVVVAQFDHGQFEFTDEGEKPSTATMSGPGVDPQDVEKSELALPHVMANDCAPVAHLVEHIRNRFKP